MPDSMVCVQRPPTQGGRADLTDVQQHFFLVAYLRFVVSSGVGQRARWDIAEASNCEESPLKMLIAADSPP